MRSQGMVASNRKAQSGRDLGVSQDTGSQPIDVVRGMDQLPNEVKAILDQGKRFRTAALALLVK
jgi:hypothetical protein